MTTCCVCLDNTAELALFSCFECHICDTCNKELTFATAGAKIFCNCANKVPIVVLTANSIDANTNSLTGPANTTEISDQVTGLQATLTKTRKDLTSHRDHLKMFISLIIKTTNTASTRIRARLRTWVSYLPEPLIAQRTAELSQELLWFNRGVVKSIQNHVEVLQDLITLHDNLLKRLSNQNNLHQFHQQYQSFQIQVTSAIQTAKAVRLLQTYDCVVYREISPISLDRVGQIVLIYSEETGNGYSITGGDYCNNINTSDVNINCYLNGRKHGRWQLASPKTFLADRYYDNGRLTKELNLWYYTTKPARWKLTEFDPKDTRDPEKGYKTNRKISGGSITGLYDVPQYIVDGLPNNSVYWSSRGMEVIEI